MQTAMYGRFNAVADRTPNNPADKPFNVNKQ
jgi:hypothetical protein